MSTNLELYRIFNAVIKAKSFSGAAKEMYISQPAVSQAIKQLEESLGTRLFIRGAKGISLTPEGEIMSGYIRSALNLIDAGEKRILSMKNLSAGELRIGAGDAVTKWYLLPIIDHFHEMHPEISLSITNRVSPDILEMLQNGNLDIGFVNMPISAEGVIFEEVKVIHDVFIAGSAYNHLRGHAVSLDELAQIPLIMLEQSACSRKWVDRYFYSHGFAINPSIEFGSHDLMADYARIGLGLACMVEEFSGNYIGKDGLFKVELAEPIPQRSIGVCYMAGIELPPAAKGFLELARDHK